MNKQFIWFDVDGVPTLFVRITNLPAPPTEDELRRGWWTRGVTQSFHKPSPEEYAEYQRMS